MWSNDITGKYMFMFPLKSLARKELICVQTWQCAVSCHIWPCTCVIQVTLSVLGNIMYLDFLSFVKSFFKITAADDSNKRNQGPYSLNSEISYSQISWSLEAARFYAILFISLWNLLGISAALLLRCLLISEWFEKYKSESPSLETSQDLAARHLSI